MQLKNWKQWKKKTIINEVEIKINQFENLIKVNMIETRKATTELINNMIMEVKKQFETKLNDIKEQQISTRTYKEEINANVINLNARVSDFTRENPHKKNNQSSSDDEHHRKKKTSSSGLDDENR
jgi:ethanolamine utilization protein EutA (predicted chaperonin)